MKLFYAIPLVALCLAACTSKSNEEVVDTTGLISVPMPAETAVDFDTLYDIEDVIVPELTENSKLKTPSRVYWTDSLLIIYDNGLNRILSFNEEGKYMGDFEKRYETLKDVVVSHGKLYAYDAGNHKMHVYTLDGRWQEEISTEFEFRSFAKADSGYWLYACDKAKNPDGYALILANETLQDTIACYFRQHPNFINVEHGVNFVVHDEANYFYWPTSNIVYQLKGNEVTPYVTVNFGDRTPNYGYLSRLSEKRIYEQYMEDNRCYRFRNVYVCGNFVTFLYRRYTISDVSSVNFAYYNRESGTCVACPQKMASENLFLRSSYNIGSTDEFMILYSRIGNSEVLRDFVHENFGVETPAGSNPVFALCRPKLK